MAYPAGWPPKPVQGLGRNPRFYVDGVGTADFADNAFLFYDDPSANTNVPTPLVAPGVPVTTLQSPHGTGVEPSDSDPRTGRVQAKPQLWARTIVIYNDEIGGADLEITFTGTLASPGPTQGVVKAPPALSPVGSTVRQEYRDRYEAGIAVKGLNVHFRIEAY